MAEITSPLGCDSDGASNETRTQAFLVPHSTYLSQSSGCNAPRLALELGTPILGSLNAASTRLDRILTAGDTQAPRYILQAFEAIHGRKPTAEEAATLMRGSRISQRARERLLLPTTPSIT